MLFGSKKNEISDFNNTINFCYFSAPLTFCKFKAYDSYTDTNVFVFSAH